MANFLAELKRRHIYRVAAAYAVVAWVLLQLVNNVAPVLDLPVWVARAFLLALIVGFPVAILFAWMRELAPADGTTARATTGKLDWVLIGALAVVIGIFVYQQVVPLPSASSAQQAAVSTATSPQPGGISVAVLPFVNLSSDKEQEFFSDGVTEEITSTLAKIPNLHVVGRTSAFQFKGENKDLTAIGQALHATHLIEGSVRKDGNEVRITAQLIRADNGTHLWTESYNRELKGVFAIQEEIATAIASALRVPLGLKEGQSLVSNRTSNIDSYQDYLQARALYRTRAVDEAVAALEGVVARDPGYAPAWALLPKAYGSAFFYNGVSLRGGSIEDQRRTLQNVVDKQEKAAREAIRLDPKLPGGYLGLARVEGHGNKVTGENLYRQALALDPGDPETLDGYSQWLFLAGRVKDSLRLREQLRLLEPFVPIYSVVTANTLHNDGQTEAAIRMFEATPSGGTVGASRNLYLAKAYAAAGRYSLAADTLLAIPQDQNRISRQSVVAAARLLRTAPAKVKAPDAFPVLEGDLKFVYLYVGAPDRVMDDYERCLEICDVLGFGDWAPEFAPVRKTERFKAFARKAGLVDYWRARGWPDLCRPMGADDFVCD